MTAEVDDRDFFADPAVVADPFSYFDRMRAACPVRREPHHDAVMVTGYDAAVDVLNRRDGTFSSAVSVAGPIPPLPFAVDDDDITDLLDANCGSLPWSAHIVAQDGDRHAAQRAIVTRLLIHDRLRRNEDYLHTLADRLIDRFATRGSCEIVVEYAHALSTYAIADMLGVPEEDRAELLTLLGPPPTSIEGDPEHKTEPDPLEFLAERFESYIRERRTAPCGDLMSDLAASRRRDGSAPTVEELARLARFMFGAGQDTSARLIAAAIQRLAEDGALQSRLRAEPGRIPDLIEETLRAEAPVKVVFRLAVRRTDVAGVDIAAGSVVAVGLGAGNRDPGRFADPAAFDIDRPQLRDHLAFSRGAHACPGAPLARAEARIAIARLLDRLSAVRISDARHGPPHARRYAYEPAYMLRSLSELHVEFEEPSDR